MVEVDDLGQTVFFDEAMLNDDATIRSRAESERDESEYRDNDAASILTSTCGPNQIDLCEGYSEINLTDTEMDDVETDRTCGKHFHYKE